MIIFQNYYHKKYYISFTWVRILKKKLIAEEKTIINPTLNFL